MKAQNFSRIANNMVCTSTDTTTKTKQVETGASLLITLTLLFLGGLLVAFSLFGNL